MPFDVRGSLCASLAFYDVEAVCCRIAVAYRSPDMENEDYKCYLEDEYGGDTPAKFLMKSFVK